MRPVSTDTPTATRRGARWRAARRPRSALDMVLIGLVLAGCGRDAGPVSASDWPMTFDEPGVLGTLTVRLSPEERERAFEQAIGWSPDGVDPLRPIVLLRLDESTYGGSVAMVLPLVDEARFRASVDASKVLRAEGDDRYRLAIDRGSGLARTMTMLSAVGASSALDVLRRIEESGDDGFVLRLEYVEDLALVTPSFEAATIVRGILRRTDGFAAAPMEQLVANIDIGRLRVVYAEQIRRLEDSARAALRGAGIGGALMGATVSPDLPVDWEVIWALKEMLSVGVEAAEIRVQPARSTSGADARLEGATTSTSWTDLFDEGGRIQVRLRLEAGDPFERLARSLRPAPVLPRAVAVIAAEPEPFAGAFANWFRPLGEVVTGLGPPGERYLDELERLLKAWAGFAAFVVDASGTPVVVVAVDPAAGVGVGDVTNWLTPLLREAGYADIDPADFVAASADGLVRIIGRDSSTVVTMGRAGAVAWLAPGELSDPPLELIARAERAVAPDGADDPCVLIDFEPVTIGLRRAVAEREVELLVTWTPSRP